jgi:hypothetical protein
MKYITYGSNQRVIALEMWLIDLLFAKTAEQEFIMKTAISCKKMSPNMVQSKPMLTSKDWVG